MSSRSAHHHAHGPDPDAPPASPEALLRRVLAVPLTTAFFATAAGTQAGAAGERRMAALRARFAR